MENTNTQVKSERLKSLDILRGITLFLLFFVGPVATVLFNVIGADWCQPILKQLDHAEWEGFYLWDLLMPQFLFMAGTSMPFSLSKYMRQDGSKAAVYRRIAKRVVVLWILGMVCQGNLLGLDPNKIYLYTNTLQSIAAGYLITAIIMLNCKVKWQVIWTVILMLVYWIGMILGGDYTQTGNFAELVDNTIMGRFRDQAYIGTDGLWHFADDYHYTWIWSSLTFGATVMIGSLTGQLLKNAKENKEKAALKLAVAGAVLIVLGLLWSLSLPIIKHIWTSSMVLFAAGISMMLLALLYYIVDCRKYSYGLDWLRMYGMNSIFVYVVGNIFWFGSVVESVSYGLQQYLGAYYDVWVAFGKVMILFIMVYQMYKCNKFWKV